jgi:hypothetical protein
MDEQYRQEILIHIEQQHATSLVILMLMLGLAVISELEAFHHVIFMIPVLGISWAFAMGRGDYLIHRLGAFLREKGDEWENWEGRTRHNSLLVLTDIGAALSIFFLTAFGILAVWNEVGRVWAVGALILFLMGTATIPLAPALFKKR